MNRCLPLLLAAQFLFSVDRGVAEELTFQVPNGQRQLFLDDHGIAELKNLRRSMHQPQKRGAVLRSPDPTETIQTRTAPVWDTDQKLFKFWVLGATEPFWQSKDGLHWTSASKPNLRTDLVVLDPHDADPARRFKAVLLNEGFATSPDGVTWTRLGMPAVSSSDEGNFSYNPQHGLFIHTVKRGGPYGRAVAIATSADFKTWKDYGVVFHADEVDQEIGRRRIQERLDNPSLKQTEYNTRDHYSVQVYNMGVFHYEGLYIGLPSMYHHTGMVPKDWSGFDKMNLSPYILGLVRQHGDYTGFYNVQLACSRDLVDWKRLGDREPFIETSPLGAGAYDIQTIIGPSAPVVRDDELWFYYTGIKQYAFIGSGNEPGYDDYVPDAGAICLAVLRRDGFISLDAKEHEGTITTKPFVVEGNTLFVNVATRKGGSLVAEVLDTGSNVIATSKPVTHDMRRAELTWAEGNFVGAAKAVVRLRFSLRDASLYSYWCETQ